MVRNFATGPYLCRFFSLVWWQSYGPRGVLLIKADFRDSDVNFEGLRAIFQRFTPYKTYFGTFWRSGVNFGPTKVGPANVGLKGQISAGNLSFHTNSPVFPSKERKIDQRLSRVGGNSKSYIICWHMISTLSPTCDTPLSTFLSKRISNGDEYWSTNSYTNKHILI